MSSQACYRLRQQRLYSYLREKDCEVGVILDFEGQRNRSLRYLCGHPADALLFLFASGESLLVPWDVPLARSLATADRLIAWEAYRRSDFEALRSIIEEARVSKVELSAFLHYPLVERLREALPGVQVECREGGIDRRIAVMRAVKDSEELRLLRAACRLTDELLAELDALLRDGKPRSELELALYIEGQARRRGAEGLGFQTLAASPRRSFAIHCHPACTTDRFAGRGFSILDFGICFGGYTSDVTVTAVGGPLSRKQEAMVQAVEEAYELACSLCAPGRSTAEIAGRVQELLGSRGFPLPHGLGHGLGLDPHEAPLFRLEAADRSGEPQRLEPGMVFTLEPGAYDPAAGGVRLENDFLCVENGIEALTSARLVYL